MMEAIFKKPLDFSKKVENNNNKSVKVQVSKEEIIKTLKILKGLEHTLQEAIK